MSYSYRAAKRGRNEAKRQLGLLPEAGVHRPLSLTRMLSPSDTLTTFPFKEAWSLNIAFGMSGTVLKV